MSWFLCAVYLFAINGLTFVAYAVDKSQARQNGYRISERTLLSLGFLGGSPAAFAAQRVLRHKTRKQSFQSQFRLTVLVQIILAEAILLVLQHGGI